jgi:hypothetical protein
LTAAHCAEDGSTVYITFDSTYTSKSKLYIGTFNSDPLYNQSQNDPPDIAVVFDKPNRGIEPGQLPTLGHFDQVDKNQQFSAVGYGGQEAVNQPGGPVISYLDTREYAVSIFDAVGPSYLRFSQNPATGSGGTCYGDSGGPNSWTLDQSRPTYLLSSRSLAMRCASPPTLSTTTIPNRRESSSASTWRCRSHRRRGTSGAGVDKNLGPSSSCLYSR